MPNQRVVPMLNCTDIQRSRAFYETLGFRLTSPEANFTEWNWGYFKDPSGAELMLMNCGQPPFPPGERPADPWAGPIPSVMYCYPDDVVALHAEVTEAGLAPDDLCVTFYGMKEFSLMDPDGHRLSFGQDTDEPPTEHHAAG